MRKIRDVLQCLLDKKFSARKTSAVTGVNRTTVSDYLKRFQKSNLLWPLPEQMDDVALETTLFHVVFKEPLSALELKAIDYEYVHSELKKPAATLSMLYVEWIESRHDGHKLSYSQFCRKYRLYIKSLKLSMRKTEVYGETAYVDYSGKTIDITNSETSEVKSAQIFVGVLGGSNYTFCEATWTQRSQDWIGSHVRMFSYFGGAPRVIVPDNLKAAVTKADRFSPVINDTYKALCRYYNTIVFPARARKPKDKPRAEGGVLLVQRWILFRLRKRKFFSLDEVNKEIRVLLDQLNHKPFQKLPGSRYERWRDHEVSLLQPMPVVAYEYAEWGKVRAGVDYHAGIQGHHYSVPHQLKGKEFEYRMTDTAVDLIYRGKSVVLHQRSYAEGKTTTLDSHRHPAHHAVQRWSMEETLEWATTVGPNTREMLHHQIGKANWYQIGKANWYQIGYRRTQAMKSLAKTYGNSRLEEVCAYALNSNISDVSEIKKILTRQLDRLLTYEESVMSPHDIEHENIRGAKYYDHLLNPTEELPV
jgi:transposase